MIILFDIAIFLMGVVVGVSLTGLASTKAYDKGREDALREEGTVSELTSDRRIKDRREHKET